jgi:hypothetical protein
VANLCYLCAALHQIDGVSGQELCRSKTIAVAASLLKYNQVKSELVVGQVTRIMKLPVLIFCLIGGTSGFAPMQRSQATPAALSMADANVDLVIAGRCRQVGSDCRSCLVGYHDKWGLACPCVSSFKDVDAC